MLANRKALILSTVLQASAFAWADPALPQNARKAEQQKTAVPPIPRINYFDLRLPSEREMQAEQSPQSPGVNHDTLSAKPTPDSLNLAPAQSLHLSHLDQRPALEYRFSDKSAVRFHIGAHGANAAASWGF